jgi:hypothetical protein
MACPWELSRKLVYLGFSDESVYKWVHPWQSGLCKEDKIRYIIVDKFSVLDRTCYPAYSIEEILNLLPDEYILGRTNNEWYCKSFSESFSDVMYYAHPILACAYTAIFVAEVKTRKAEEDSTEEVNLKKGEIFGETKRKLIVDITGKPFTFCCDELKEFAKSHYFYLHFQIRDMKKLDPINPCLILGDDEGNKSWYTCCPFCRADIVVKEVKRKHKAEEGEVEEK